MVFLEIVAIWAPEESFFTLPAPDCYVIANAFRTKGSIFHASVIYLKIFGLLVSRGGIEPPTY